MAIRVHWQRLNACLTAALVLIVVYTLNTRIRPAVRYHISPRPHPILLEDARYPLHSNKDASLSVNLVVASLAKDDVSWAADLPIPNLSVLRYVSDDPFADLRPPAARGREALMYFTYLHDYYDSLPDLSVFVHAEETPWHVEGTLLRNTTFVLSQLDLGQVMSRGYFNLRVTGRAGCPAWINTTKTFDDWDKEEEPYMRMAWEGNFGADPIPEMLGGPCCSQFAVSRDVIRQRSKEQYRRGMDWLMQTPWSDYVLGRVWEHMWPWLFTNKASDCQHPERESLCQVYSLCFTKDRILDAYKELWNERERLKEDMSFFRAVWRPAKAAAARQTMDVVDGEIENQLSLAWRNGQDASIRAEVLNQFASRVVYT